VERLITDFTIKIITVQTKLTVSNNPVWYALHNILPMVKEKKVHIKSR